MTTEEGCPNPNTSNFTTPGENNEEPTTKREFTISLSSDESIKYLLEIEQNDKLLNLSLKPKEENIILSFYTKSFTLESLKIISKLFRLYDSINEVIYYLFEELENNKQVLKLDKNLNMLLVFSYQIPGAKKADEIILCLEKSNLKNEDINNILVKEIIKMKKEIKQLKEENEKLKTMIETKKEDKKDINIEEIINTKIEKIKDDINNRFKEYETEIKDLKYQIEDSKKIYLTDISKYIKIINEKIPEYKDKNIKMKLIYDANKDGQNYTNCHEKCNNIPNTLSLITTTKDKKFGFFRSISINGQGPWKVDNKAFFISYDKNKVYKIKSNQNSVAFDNSCFIQTKPFTLIGNILNDKYSCADKDNMNQYFEGFTENYELNGGERDFRVKKFEVYRLEI